MRQGCISLGDTRCDECQSIIPYSERYLIIKETKGSISRLCVDCSLKKGDASYTLDKGERVLTFLGE